MFPAAKFGDLVIGVDLHMVNVPAPPSPIPVPTPLPHVFVGVVFDPLGLAISAGCGKLGVGGLNLINGMPAANAGTDVIGYGHNPTPPGASFAPNDIPDNRGTIITGSKTVSMSGTSAARLTSMVSSCNYPVNMPTSTCLAIPGGPPVLIGGPTSVDAMAAVTRGIRTKWFSDALHKVLKPGPRLSKTICFLTGHPVDVMTGEVLTDAVDFELPGHIPLVFQRDYYSRSRYDGPLGPGWHHVLDASVHEAELDVKIRLPDGRERVHERLAAGQSLWDDIDRYTLERTEQGYRLTFWHGQCWHFKPVPGARTTHALVCITDRCNNAIHLRYAAGELSEVTDSMGRELRFVCEGRRLRSIRLRQKNGDKRWLELVRYEYDEQRRLAAAFDPKNEPLRYAYVGGVLMQETNRNGLSFHFEYDWDDPDGWCVRTWGDDGIYDRVITYNKHRHFTVVEDSRGGTTLYYGNAAGLVDREVDPTGRERRYEWDQSYRKVAEIDGLGNRTEWAYDKRGNMVLVRDPLNRETSWTYNELNLPIRMVNPAGGQWSMTYDVRGKLARVVNPLGHEYLLIHDSRGRLVVFTDPGGNTTRVRYGEAGEFIEVTDAEGGVSRSELDAMGRTVRHANALGGITALTWDDRSRLVGIRWPEGSTERRSYDPEGNLIKHVRRDETTVRYRYGGLNRLITQIDPAGRKIQLRYDTEENLTAIVNEAGEEYLLEYDLAGRVVKEQGFDGRKTETLYDGAGRACEIVNAQKKRRKIEWDGAGRMVKRIVPGRAMAGRLLPPGETYVYEYDELDGLVRAVNSSGDVTFKRDLLGRVVEETFNGVTIAVRYGKTGARVERSTSLGHKTLYETDGRGDLLSLTFGIDPRWMGFSPEALHMGGPPVRAPWKATWKRDAAGNEMERKLPGGVISRWEHDQSGRPQAHRVFSGDELLSGVDYRWKPGAQIASLIDLQKGETRFSHDERGYLIAATRPDGSVQYRVPDDVGNLYRTWDQKDRTYGAGGVLEKADGVEYRHDADGRLIEKIMPNGERWKYGWDYADQLVEVLRPDGERVTFTYDALGRRASKTMNGRTTCYVWDGDVVVHELIDGEPLITWEMEPETFAPIAKVERDKKYGVVSDHLDTPAALLDEAGKLAWNAQLDLYGVSRAEVETTVCPWRWPGQYEDSETGLYYNRFRYYDTGTGRYISQDLIGLIGGIKLYQYVSDPLCWIDPFGLAACDKITRQTRRLSERELQHAFDSHRVQLLGYVSDRATDFARFSALVDRGRKSGLTCFWRSGESDTIAHLARVEGKYILVQFFRSGPTAGDIATAFRPNNGQLSRILQLISRKGP